MAALYEGSQAGSGWAQRLTLHDDGILLISETWNDHARSSKAAIRLSPHQALDLMVALGRVARRAAEKHGVALEDNP